MSVKIKAIPCVLTGFRTLVDGSITTKIDFVQELTPEEKMFLLERQNTNSYVFISDVQEEFSEEKIVEAMPDTNRFANKKTNSLSDRLRKALFRLHKAKGGINEDFEDFRKEMMESIITFYTNKAKEIE